ncbi:MAG: FmdB family zinc ribbon protein [Acidimicrobiales bacterium]|jgi:putative FmdB family regulatory protein
MPTYEYECQTCHERVEAVQKFTDPSLTICPNCGGELRKVFSAVGIVFKGSGFYKNDSRGAKTTSAPSSATSDTTTTAPSGDSSSTPAPAAPPAASTKKESSSTTASSSSD